MKIIIANWKMNPGSEREALALAKKIDFSNVVIASPFVFLNAVGKTIKKAFLGAQDLFWESKGAFTGEVSAAQLKSSGVRYVIIGHSERRTLGETDATVNEKVKAAVGAGLKVVLCVGEDWPVRKKGLTAAKKFVKMQLIKDLRGLTNDKQLTTNNLIIAYEPVWAIGSGKADKSEETVEIANLIKKLLVVSYKFKVKVLYGGSVTARNAKEFLNRREIDGALVGGASLKPGEFRKIVAAARG